MVTRSVPSSRALTLENAIGVSRPFAATLARISADHGQVRALPHASAHALRTPDCLNDEAHNHGSATRQPSTATNGARDMSP